VRQRIQLPAAQPPPGTPAVIAPLIAPKFGRCCVCCNADAQGRTKDYRSMSTAPGVARAIAVPVCSDCDSHALSARAAPTLQTLLWLFGLAIALGAVLSLLMRAPAAPFWWAAIVVGVAMIGAALRWQRRTGGRALEQLVAGHHTQLEIWVLPQRIWIDTDNEDLARELLALNVFARVMPEPPLWKWRRRRQMPAARVVRSRVL
jgi:hypothetical protein